MSEKFKLREINASKYKKQKLPMLGAVLPVVLYRCLALHHLSLNVMSKDAADGTTINCKTFSLYSVQNSEKHTSRVQQLFIECPFS